MAQLIFRKPGEAFTKRKAPAYIVFKKALIVSAIINIVLLGLLLLKIYG